MQCVGLKFKNALNLSQLKIHAVEDARRFQNECRVSLHLEVRLRAHFKRLAIQCWELCYGNIGVSKRLLDEAGRRPFRDGFSQLNEGGVFDEKLESAQHVVGVIRRNHVASSVEIEVR